MLLIHKLNKILLEHSDVLEVLIKLTLNLLLIYEVPVTQANPIANCNVLLFQSLSPPPNVTFIENKRLI